MNPKELQIAADVLRRDVLEMTTAAGSGHPSSCLSSSELAAVLWFNEMFYDPSNPNHPHNDEFVLSKGHAAPLYYACLQQAGCIQEDLMRLRKIDSPLEGHPMPQKIPWIKAATGSLGQGLAIGCGMALGARMRKSTSRTYVLMGDSECSEGSVWEAVQFAAYHELTNLVAIVDVNRLGQRGETMLGHDLQAYKKRFEAFGWHAIALNGHKISEIITSLKKARSVKKPVVLLAKTLKGHGLSFMENKEGWHGRALTPQELTKALKEIPVHEFPAWEAKIPLPAKELSQKTIYALPLRYESNEQHATREGYGRGLARLAADNTHIIALDAEVSNSTYAEKVKERTPEQYIECFIAEQTLISVAQGLAIKHFVPYTSTFASFLTRAHDQLRMAALSGSHIITCGSHAGCSIGEDGASQMGLDDIAMMRALPNTTVLYPGDALAAERLVQLAAHQSGLVYIRTTRAKTPLIYNAKEEFMVYDFKAPRLSNNDSAVIVGAGITLHEAIKAHDQLKKQGISTAVVDAYCIKPFPGNKFIEFVKKHGGRVCVVEDHYTEGGLGEMIAHVLAGTSIPFRHLAVQRIPHSGTQQHTLEAAGIDAQAIITTLRTLVK